MNQSDLDSYIERNVAWEELPSNIRSSLGNSSTQWDSAILNYSLRNQLRWKTHTVKDIFPDEKGYYEKMVQYGKDNLMLFPYHLSVQIIQRLRISPFKYYSNMIFELMFAEKSYDTLPNFTAIDCLLNLGIGRNQYIDLMNSCRAKKFFKAKRIRDVLPTHPAPLTQLEDWWIIHLGFVTEEDVRSCSRDEHKFIDFLIDTGPTPVGEVDQTILRALCDKDLLYFEVPIQENDRMSLPPLEGFVMNRVQGDAIETLLYKIFLSISEDCSVRELADIVEGDTRRVRQAISLFIRLGLVKRRFLLEIKESDETKFPKNDVEDRDSSSDEAVLVSLISKNEIKSKRLGFLYDSSLTAYLMMGNLSPGLKTHAVTMFEVGKLSEENLDSFMDELSRISVLSEGEAQRYFDHAHALHNTLSILRGSTDQANYLPTDLLRCESINQLDPSTRQRLLSTNYCFLISMAPLSFEGGVSDLDEGPPLLGPPCREFNSVWFKLWLYQSLGIGPPSLLLTRGTRINIMPLIFKGYSQVLLTTWGHDPTPTPLSTLLQTINDALTHSSVFLQAIDSGPATISKKIAFPINPNEPLLQNPAVKMLLSRLHQVINLDCSCGFITLVKRPHPSIPPFFKPYSYGQMKRCSEVKPIISSTLPSNATSQNSPECSATSTDPQIENHVPEFHETSNAQSDAESSSVQSLAENFLKELDNLKLFDDSTLLDNDMLIEPQSTKQHNFELSDHPSLTSTDRLPLSSEWVVLDLSFGVPLFDIDLNTQVCHTILSKELLSPENLRISSDRSLQLSKELRAFIDAHLLQSSTIQSWSLWSRSVISNSEVQIPNPTKSLMFNEGRIHIL